MEQQPFTQPIKKAPFMDSVIFKLSLIGILTLLLLIPSHWIQGLISERQMRQEEVNTEIAEKWSGPQRIGGPVLIIPYKTINIIKDSTGKVTYKDVVEQVYLLPDALDIKCNTLPEVRHRGNFDAIVYSSKIKVSGRFGDLELNKSGINPDNLQWDKAKFSISVTDLKGLKDNLVLTVNNQKINTEPDFNDNRPFKNTLSAAADLAVDKQTKMDFNFEMDLRGSRNLEFIHFGKQTTLYMQGEWKDPKFIGPFSPDQSVTGTGHFEAKWKLAYFHRSFPQQWKTSGGFLDPNKDVNGAGVEFLLPVDQYQQTMRTAKYGILIILLTFISLFFTELLTRNKVHLLQYILIGAAMIVYYTLLLAFSEQLGFNWAYLIASVATVLLIGTFISALLKDRKPALLFSGILSVFYGFIYIIIQLQDLALLSGSIGLFIVVAALMRLSQKINWYNRASV